MRALRLKQVGLALCLMASLLTASPAACTCSHHEETKSTEIDCHSHHGSAELTESTATGNTIDDACICAVDQRPSYVATPTEGKELRSQGTISNGSQVAPDFEFVAIATSPVPVSTFTNDLSYSTTLKSLLPSRAPPRL